MSRGPVLPRAVRRRQSRLTSLLYFENSENIKAVMQVGRFMRYDVLYFRSRKKGELVETSGK